MGRVPCCSKVGLHRGPWTAKEDAFLTDFIKNHGEGNWRSLRKKAGLLKCGKSCRLRWMNYLRPDIKRGNINQDEEDLIVRLHSLLGNKWSLIAGRLPGRTDNEIKNYWNSHLSKKLKSQGIEVTCSPKARLRHGSKDHNTESNNKDRIWKKKEKKSSAAAAVELETMVPRTQIHAPKPTRFKPTLVCSNVMAMDSSSQGSDRKIEEEDDITRSDFSQDQAGLIFDCDFSYDKERLFENLYQEYSQLLR